MAEKLPPYGKPLYNSKGAYRWCNNEADLRQARTDGFTLGYVFSKWPTTVYHKKTGESKSIGNFEWTDEQNEAAIKALGPDWCLEHVGTIEPQRVNAADTGTSDVTSLERLVNGMAVLEKRIEDLEEVATEFAGIRRALELRVADLEGLIEEASAPREPPAPSIPKAAPASNTKETVKAK